MKAAPKLKAIRRTPTEEDIKMWQQNPHDERLPVPPTEVHGFTPGYRKAGGPVDGKPTVNILDFMKKFNTAYGESFYSHFADGGKSPFAHVGMTAAEGTALVKAYERKEKEMPGMFGQETGTGFFKSICINYQNEQRLQQG